MSRMKFQVAILNRVIIIVQCVLWAIFILYANCIYMYLRGPVSKHRALSCIKVESVKI